MPKKESIDRVTRRRIVDWVLYEMERQGIPKKADLARRLGVNRSTVTRIFDLDRALGLDVFIKIHRKLPIDATRLLNDPPPRPRKGQRTSPQGQPSSPPEPA